MKYDDKLASIAQITKRVNTPRVHVLHSSAFTIVELLIVIVIIAILAAINPRLLQRYLFSC